MRKIYSFILLMLLPILAIAQNQAISKTQRTSTTTLTDSRLYVDASVLQPVVASEANSYTLGVWVKLSSYLNQSGTDATSNQVILGYGGREHCNDNGCWNLCINGSGNFNITGWGAKGAGGAITGTTVSLNEWHYIVAVYDADAPSLSFYLDGALVANKPMTSKHEWFVNEHPALYFMGYGFGGLMDEVQIFNRALSAEEVAIAQVNSQAVDGLLGLYTFDETPATTGEFPNQSSYAGATTLPLIFENCEATNGNAWANGIVNLIDGSGSVTPANPTLVEGREIAPTEVTVTIMDGEGGTLTATDGETTYTANDEGYTILTGTTLTLNAVAEAGHNVIGVYATNADMSEMTEIANGGTYTVVKDIILTARYTNEFYTLTLDNQLNVPYTLTYGGEDVTDLTQLMGGGAEYKLTLNVPENLILESVQLGGQDVAAVNGVYTLTFDADATLTINARNKAEYTVTINQPQGGTVTVSKGTTTINSGDKVFEGDVLTLSNTKDAGYTFVNYTVNGNNTSSATITVTDNVTVSAVFEEGVEYCIPTGTPSNARYVSTFKVSDNDGSTITIAGNGAAKGYTDRNESIFVTKAGKEITLQITEGSGSWQHTYLHIDYGRDGTFDFSPEISGANGDLVSYNCYNGKNSLGETVSTNQSVVGTIPTFTIPSDLAPGLYQARLRLAWNNADACLDLTDQGTETGRACIDFMIRIESDEYETARTITVASDNELGTVAITSPATTGSSVSTTQKNVTVKATPANDAAFINWTDAENNVVSTDATYTYTGENDIELTAHFGYTLNFTVGAEGSATVQVNSTTVASGNVFAPGATVSMTVDVPDGKEVIVTINGNTVTLEANAYSFVLEANADIQVQFVDRINRLHINVSGNGSVQVWTEMGDSEGIPAGTQLFDGDIIPAGAEVFVWFIPATDGNDTETLEEVIVTNGDTQESLVADEDYYVPLDAGTAEEGEPLATAYFYPVPRVLGDITLEPTFSTVTQGIEEIGIDPANGPVEYYNLQGVRVAAENLVPGFYIIRQGSKTAKVLIRK